MSVSQALKSIDKARKKIADSTFAIAKGKLDRAVNRNDEADERLVKAIEQLEDEPVPPPVYVDQIDPTIITYLHADVSGWGITSETTKVEASDPAQMCIEHTKAGQWVANADGLEGNPWACAFIDGQWYAATYEWLRSGQICKGMGVPQDSPNIAEAFGPHIKQNPMDKWVPQAGEHVGFFVSTLARDSQRNGDERSNIVLIVWPY